MEFQAVNTLQSAETVAENDSIADDNETQILYTLTGMLMDVFQLPERGATVYAKLMLNRMQEEWGGDKNFYLPARSKRERDDAIRRAFTGANIEALSRDFNVSTRTVRRVLSERSSR
jgi:Mor family transcriptional regulator